MKRENAAKRYYRKNMIVFIVIFVPLTLLSFFFPLVYTREAKEFATLWSLPIIIASVSFPFIIYYTVQFIHYANVYFTDIQAAEVFDCDTIHRGRYGTFIGFFVRVQHNGEKMAVCTKHVHQVADGYVGSQVEVGFDPKRMEWIVLEW